MQLFTVSKAATGNPGCRSCMVKAMLGLHFLVLGQGPAASSAWMQTAIQTSSTCPKSHDLLMLNHTIPSDVALVIP